MHSERVCAKRGSYCPIRAVSGRFLFGVFAADGELFRGFDAHFRASARAAEQRDLNRPIGEQLSKRDRAIRPFCRLDHYRFVGTSAQHKHGIQALANGRTAAAKVCPCGP